VRLWGRLLRIFKVFMILTVIVKYLMVKVIFFCEN